MKTNGKQTKEYTAWVTIKGRCYNPNNISFPRYGAKGVKMCERWKASFSDFLADMGHAPSLEHSIDRINYTGDYTPENCRWATDKEQQRNRSNNRLLTLNGITHCVNEWCELLGIGQGTLMGRIKRGWSDEKCLTKPVKNNPRSGKPRYITFQGKTLRIGEWANLLGIKRTTLQMRLDVRKWPVEKAFTP